MTSRLLTHTFGQPHGSVNLTRTGQQVTGLTSSTSWQPAAGLNAAANWASVSARTGSTRGAGNSTSPSAGGPWAKTRAEPHASRSKASEHEAKARIMAIFPRNLFRISLLQHNHSI